MNDKVPRISLRPVAAERHPGGDGLSIEQVAQLDHRMLLPVNDCEVSAFSILEKRVAFTRLIVHDIEVGSVTRTDDGGIENRGFKGENELKDGLGFGR